MTGGDAFDAGGAVPGRLAPADNPFAIAPGQIPPVMAGRDDLLVRLRDQLDRTARRMPGEWWIVEGHHGLGRTALLSRVAEAAADRDVEALVLDVAAGPAGMQRALAQHRFRHGGPDEGSADLGRAVADVVADAETRSRQTVVMVDNADTAPVLAAEVFRGAQYAAAGRGAVSGLVTGLPGTCDALATVVPAVERMPVETLSLFDRDGVRRAVEDPFAKHGVSMTADAVSGVTVHSHGHPHHVQLWGRELWREAVPVRGLGREDVLAAAPRVQLAMDQMHRRRWARLDTPAREFLAAVARTGSDRATPGELVGRLGAVAWDPTSVYERLVRTGIVATNPRGQVELTMPRMGEWVANRTASEVLRASWSRS